MEGNLEEVWGTTANRYVVEKLCGSTPLPSTTLNKRMFTPGDLIQFKLDQNDYIFVDSGYWDIKTYPNQKRKIFFVYEEKHALDKKDIILFLGKESKEDIFKKFNVNVSTAFINSNDFNSGNKFSFDFILFINGKVFSIHLLESAFLSLFKKIE